MGTSNHRERLQENIRNILRVILSGSFNVLRPSIPFAALSLIALLEISLDKLADTTSESKRY